MLINDNIQIVEQCGYCVVIWDVVCCFVSVLCCFFYDDNLYTNASVMLIDDDSHFAVELILTILLTICWVDTVSMIILIFVGCDHI